MKMAKKKNPRILLDSRTHQIDALQGDNCNISNLTLIMYIVEEVLGWPGSWITRNSSTGTYFPVISIQNLDFLAPPLSTVAGIAVVALATTFSKYYISRHSRSITRQHHRDFYLQRNRVETLRTWELEEGLLGFRRRRERFFFLSIENSQLLMSYRVSW